jgi:signal transduction histidine kinase
MTPWVTITDSTRSERYRRERERTTEQLVSFAGVLAHDLSNPPGVAQGYTELARDDHDSGPLQEIRAAHTRRDDYRGPPHAGPRGPSHR